MTHQPGLPGSDPSSQRRGAVGGAHLTLREETSPQIVSHQSTLTQSANTPQLLFRASSGESPHNFTMFFSCMLSLGDNKYSNYAVIIQYSTRLSQQNCLFSV